MREPYYRLILNSFPHDGKVLLFLALNLLFYFNYAGDFMAFSEWKTKETCHDVIASMAMQIKSHSYFQILFIVFMSFFKLNLFHYLLFKAIQFYNIFSSIT